MKAVARKLEAEREALDRWDKGACSLHPFGGSDPLIC